MIEVFHGVSHCNGIIPGLLLFDGIIPYGVCLCAVFIPCCVSINDIIQ